MKISSSWLFLCTCYSLKRGATSLTLKIRRRVQEIRRVEEFFVLDESHFRIDIIDEVKSVTDNNT